MTSALPVEILQRIFKFLRFRDQARCQLVCRQWSDSLENYWGRTNELVVGNPEGIFLLENNICFQRIPVPIYFESLLWCLRKFGANLKIMRVRFFGMDIFNDLIVENCANLHTLEIQDSHLFYDNNLTSNLTPFLSMKALKRLSIFDTEFSPQSDLGTKANNDDNSAALTHLHLENVKNIEYGDFISFCHRCSPSLENFCFKFRSCNIGKNDLQSGFLSLTNLRHFNLGKSIKEKEESVVGSIIDDKFLQDLANCMPNLETLSLQYAKYITSVGLNNILTMKKLSYLDVTHCPLVDDLISFGLKNRSKNDIAFLTVFAFGTKISANFDMATVNFHGEVILDPRLDELLFFGNDKVGFMAGFSCCLM